MKTNSKGFVPIFILIVILIAAVTVGSYYFGLKKNNQVSPSPEAINSTPPSPTPKETPTPGSSSLPKKSYKVPSNWKQYSVTESGITVSYPPDYNPKYNSNRGAGMNYSAGSYLINQSGQKILDFYFYNYDGGSRRENFYKALEFDGPGNMSSFTVSTKDVSLNGKVYLKLITNFYAKTWNEVGNRVFFLIPQGKHLYYFTYLQSIESNPAEFNKVLTIIANSKLSESVQPIGTNYVSCYPTTYGQKNLSWDARLESDGSMTIVQRTTEELKNEVDKMKIELWPNFQDSNFTSVWNEISNYTITIDPSLKGDYKSAFVFNISKSEVDKIREKTPGGVSSLAIYSKVNGGIKTIDDKLCTTGAVVGYFISK